MDVCGSLCSLLLQEVIWKKEEKLCGFHSMWLSYWMATEDGRRVRECRDNYGHSRGAKNLEVICEDAYNIGIKYLTVYLFSTENWKRSKEEVDGLMRLFRSYTKTCIKTAQKNNMKVRVLGDPTALDPDLQESLKKLVEQF